TANGFKGGELKALDGPVHSRRKGGRRGRGRVRVVVERDVDEEASVTGIRQRDGNTLARSQMPFGQHPIPRVQAGISGRDVVLHVLLASKRSREDLRMRIDLGRAWRPEGRANPDAEAGATGNFACDAGIAANVTRATVREPGESRNGHARTDEGAHHGVASQLLHFVGHVLREEPIPEPVADQKRTTDHGRTGLLAGAVARDEPRACGASAREEERRVYLRVEAEMTVVVSVPAVDDPTPEGGYPVAVLWLVAVGDEIVVRLDDQQAGKGVPEAEPGDLGAGAVGARLCVAAPVFEVRATPAVSRS